ncbi:transcription factor S-II, central domain-containing protein [Radiomyces spectabilis]|uniref:transcription factor S-II, central domain-containing protein n=1 Tax=Radiomyces spectabilis TaxID=64574 RepID=UPI0022212260|nr:transcription factor S-II, central domain-containing protein [Radiomyces spectabilis]KAI8384944.1 transcription factor S-II, central domain-containing protein [Radiomyces spectabilis]
MGSEDEILKAKRALQKANETNNTQAMMDIMGRLIKIKASQELLRKTDIGKIMGKLRSNANTAVSQKAKEIVRKWKDDVILESKAPAPSPVKKINTSTGCKASHPSSTASSPKTPSETGPPRTVKTDEVTFKTTGSTPRDKTIELLYAAVALGSYADSELLLKRAMAIEKAVFGEYEFISEGYKSKIRSLALNLKSKSNPTLRESVVSGELPVDKLCTMSVEDMASEEAKARDRKLAEEALFKARGAGSAQAETDMFICGKCKKRRCTYFQMQTRSADEPMTTFVTCVTCGNHWKVGSSFIFFPDDKTWLKKTVVLLHSSVNGSLSLGLLRVPDRSSCDRFPIAIQ